MKEEVKKTEAAVPAVASTKALTVESNTWGSEGTSTTDLILPRLRMLQAISKAVSDGKGKAGDILHSMTGELLAERGAVLEVLPISCIRTWGIFEIAGKNLDFRRKEPMTAENENQDEVGYDEDGKPIKKVRCLSYLVLCVKKLTTFPFFVDFQKTSYRAGKTLSSIIQENALMNRPSAARVIGLSAVQQTYEKNSWYGWAVAPTRDATKEELTASKKWFDSFHQAVKDNRVAADEEAGKEVF